VNIITKYDRKQAHLTSCNDDGSIDSKPVDQIIVITKRHFKKGEFFLTHFDLPKLLIEKNYNGTTYRVLMYLITQLDFNNRIKTFRQVDIAEAIQTNQANVSRALKALESDRIIKKRGNDFYFNLDLIKGAGDKS